MASVPLFGFYGLCSFEPFSPVMNSGIHLAPSALPRFRIVLPACFFFSDIFGICLEFQEYFI